MPRVWLWGTLGVCLAIVIGCQGSTPAGKQVDGEGQGGGETAEGAKTPGQESVKPLLPVLEKVDSWEGHWVLQPYMGRRFVNLWLFRLSKGDNDAWTVETIANEPSLGEVIPGEVQVTDQAVRIGAQLSNPKAQIKNAKVNFEGALRDGKVMGNFLFADQGLLLPAQLVPTDADSLGNYQDMVLVEGSGEFEKAARDPDPARGLWRFAKERADSPLALDAYGFLFNQIHQWNLSDQEIQDAVADFSKSVKPWGSRLQGFSQINVGMQLARARKSITLAEELFNDGAGRVQELSIVDAILKVGRLDLLVAKALQAIGGKDEEAAKAAYADLQEILRDHPYRPDLLLAAAEYAEKHQNPDGAINDYLTIVALPMLQRMALANRIGLVAGDPTPGSSLQALWKEKHGSLDGLKEAVAERYAARIEKLLEEIREKSDPFPAADASNRVVLTEIFTGGGCEPCIAADFAGDLLVRGLPAEEAIVLNYHNHVPLPDPLTNMDSEERATYYNAQGTPFVAVNGQRIDGVAGPFLPDAIQAAYQRLRAPVDFFLKSPPTDVAIELKAEAADGKLNVNVAVTGVPEADMKNVRLRLAVVEDEVAYSAPNGIRRHSMVVRAMLGGAKGIAAKQGKLAYSLPLPLAELKGRQLGYLLNFEQGKRQQFPEKPVEYKTLRLVAFVQNDQTKEVLQAASTPVTGELIYPEFKLLAPGQTEQPESSEKPSEEKPATEKKPDEDKPADDKPKDKSDN